MTDAEACALAAELGAVCAAQARRIDDLEQRLAASEATALELLIDQDQRIAALEARLNSVVTEISPPEPADVKHPEPLRLLDAAD